MKKIIRGIVDGEVIKPSESINAKEVFIIVPGEKEVNLNKIKRIKVDPIVIDEIIEGTEYGEGID